MFTEMFKFSIDNNIIPSKQYGFKPGDSCMNQPLSITHKNYKSWMITGSSECVFRYFKSF